MAALAQEITAEIDQEILLSLRSLASTEFTYDQSLVSGTATFVGDEHAALAVLINRTANLIAQRTRRGAGNYAVVSPASFYSQLLPLHLHVQLKVHLKHLQTLSLLVLLTQQ